LGFGVGFKNQFMKRIIFIALLLSGFAVGAFAQSSVDSVKAVINTLFTAMKTSDGVLLATCFSDSAIMQTIAKDRTGGALIRNEIVGDFIKQVAGLPKGAADERIKYDVVKVDGPLAIVWTPYQFYYNGQFSHCGANSFQLVRLNGAWKIQYLIDTRRKEGCLEKKQ